MEGLPLDEDRMPQTKIGAMATSHRLEKMNYNTRKSNADEHVSKFRPTDAAEPREGVRLIKAFLEIKDPAWREKLIRLAEDLAKASSDRLGTAHVEEKHERAFRGFDVLATPR